MTPASPSQPETKAPHPLNPEWPSAERVRGSALCAQTGKSAGGSMPAGFHRDHRTPSRSVPSHPRTSHPRGGRVVTLLAGLSLLAACEREPKLGDPIAGLTKEQREQFERGKEAFATEFCTETGLGPLFNANSCAECHES